MTRTLVPVQVVGIRSFKSTFEVVLYDGTVQRIRFMAKRTQHEDVLSAYARIDPFLRHLGFVRECNSD